MSKPDHSGIFPRTAAASVVCACGVNVPQHASNDLESDLVKTEAALLATQQALAMTLLWAMVAEGGYTELTKVYYAWAMAVKEKIPGNPVAKDVLDAALKHGVRCDL